MSGSIFVYHGGGRGKSTAALGRAVRAASQDGKSVYVVQFMKFRTEAEMDFLRRLEPEIKFFRFEKSDENFTDLGEDEQREEVQNIKNGLNFAKKVLSVGEADMVILDEVLGLVDTNIIALEEMISLIHAKGEEMDLILTGKTMVEGLAEYVDEIYNIKSEK